MFLNIHPWGQKAGLSPPESQGCVSITIDWVVGSFPRERILSKRASIPSKEEMCFLLLPNVSIYCLRKGDSKLVRRTERSETVDNSQRSLNEPHGCSAVLAKQHTTPYLARCHQLGLLPVQDEGLQCIIWGEGAGGPVLPSEGGILLSAVGTPLRPVKVGTLWMKTLTSDAQVTHPQHSQVTLCALVTSLS